MADKQLESCNEAYTAALKVFHEAEAAARKAYGEVVAAWIICREEAKAVAKRREAESQ